MPQNNRESEAEDRDCNSTKSISSLTSMLTAFPHFSLDQYKLLVGTETKVFIWTEMATNNKVWSWAGEQLTFPRIIVAPWSAPGQGYGEGAEVLGHYVIPGLNAAFVVIR